MDTSNNSQQPNGNNDDWGSSTSDTPTKPPLKKTGPIYLTDVWVYRIIVIALSLAIIICLGGSIYLTFEEKDLPEILIAIASGSIGALAGLLSPGSRR